MEVILLESIAKLGNVGSIVNVKNGHARNFLIPQGKVLRATNENKAQFAKDKAKIEKQNEEKRKSAETQSKKIADKFVVITRQAGEDGRLFGSVSLRDIAAAITELGIEINRTQVSLDKPIKYLGIYQERVTLHPEVIINIHVNVARNKDEAKEAEKLFLNPPKEDVDKKDIQEEQSKKETATKEKESADSPNTDSTTQKDPKSES